MEFLVKLVFSLVIIIGVESEHNTCILPNPKDPIKTKLLDNLFTISGYKFLTTKNGFSYALCICGEVSKANHPNASVTRTLVDKNVTTVLGRYNESDILQLGENEFLLTYSGGDNIVNESAACNNTKWKTLIYISCNHELDMITLDLLDPLNAGCFAFFHLKSPIHCQTKSSVYIWPFIVVVLITYYFACGIIYKRCYKGAKGWEQLPHHEFWRNPLRHLMGCLRGNEEVQISRNSSNDPADEPLLRP